MGGTLSPVIEDGGYGASPSPPPLAHAGKVISGLEEARVRRSREQRLAERSSARVAEQPAHKVCILQAVQSNILAVRKTSLADLCEDTRG